MTTLLLVVGAYLIGSISFAIIVSRIFGLSDPRTYGSHNPGATNVLRSGHKAAAALTLFGDAFKGWAIVWLTHHYSQQLGLSDSDLALAAIAVFIGHLWPILFRFVGGKGVATALGVLLGINVWLGAATLATWLIIAYALRYSSLAALMAAVFAPFYYGLLFGIDPMLAAVATMSILLVTRHAKNIANLLAGRESKIGAGKKRSS